MPKIDPITLTQELIRCPSVTPIEAGAITLLQETLTEMGFTCHRMTFEEEGTEPVENLYARLGTSQPNLCFAGHTDVVPVGQEDAWSFGPFSGDIIDGNICGRGAADMKGGIAAFVAAVSHFLDENQMPADKSISFLITGDEEGPSVNGTKKVLQWMAEKGEEIDLCIVGEPTNPSYLGEMIKLGRRGSVSFILDVFGQQGHVAYPHLADNPMPKIIKLADEIANCKLDEGSEHFQPSNLEITSIDVGNDATNIIPEQGRIRFNIRFNDHHTGTDLVQKIDDICKKHGVDYKLTDMISGESFITDPGRLTDMVQNAAEKVTGHRPELSTTGGTSDARFITNYCPVIEFGIIGKTMHKVDEHVAVKDLQDLTEIYHHILLDYMAA